MSCFGNEHNQVYNLDWLILPRGAGLGGWGGGGRILRLIYFRTPQYIKS